MVTKQAEPLTKVCETLSNSYIEDWKKQGKKVLGYTCTYLPEEILMAADILPYRMRATGCGGTSLADTWLTRIAHCSFARSVLELALTNEFDFLDGVVFTNSCDHIRRAYENWKYQDEAPTFMHILPVPHVTTEDGLQWYREEVAALMDYLEKEFNVKITPEKIKEATKICNESRSLLKEVYELREREAPPISGAEVMRIGIASVSMPRDKFNEMLKEMLPEIKNRKGISNYRARLMIVGSVDDSPIFLELIEDTGGLVVADGLCFGAKLFGNINTQIGDTFDSITAHYYHNILCPRMYGDHKRRLSVVKDVAKKANVDGVVLQAIKFCDLHGIENVLLEKGLQKEGLATLKLEREYGPLADMGRYRTRVQAFLEQIGK